MMGLDGRWREHGLLAHPSNNCKVWSAFHVNLEADQLK